MRNEMADVLARDFVIFKVGTWNGETFTEDDLDNMVKSYNADEPPHIIAGHGSDYKGQTMIPSFGRVMGGLKRVGKELVAMGTQFNETMANWIKEGFYNQRSIELTKDNKRVLAIGMLGATPPAVKKMPLMQLALKEEAMQYSEFADSKNIEFVDNTKDIFEGIAQSCGIFLEKMETLFNQKADSETLMKEVVEFKEDVLKELNVQEKQSNWKEFKDKLTNLFNKRKESVMDELKEKEYQAKIAEQDTKLKEFSEKERLANEAKAKADADAEEAEAKAKDESLKTEIKIFCETVIKENRMTPAMQEKDEPIMFSLGKASPDALKSFQEKYATPIVPLGETKELNEKEKEDNDKRPQVIKSAEKYAKAHPKEFSGLSAEDAISRAVFLHSRGKIKFEDK